MKRWRPPETRAAWCVPPSAQTLQPSDKDGDHPGVGAQPVAGPENDSQVGGTVGGVSQRPGVVNGDIRVVRTVDDQEGSPLQETGILFGSQDAKTR